MADLQWTDAHWDRVNSVVTEEFAKTSVIGKVLPCYGPIAGNPESVRDDRLTQFVGDPGVFMQVDSNRNLRFWKLTVNVILTGQQVADESLSGAMLAFRRAATQMAKAEDYIAFCGYAPYPDYPPDASDTTVDRRQAFRTGLGLVMPAGLHLICGDGDNRSRGLLEAGGVDSNGAVRPNPLGDPRFGQYYAPPPNAPGELLTSIISDGIGALERESHSSPFACVLGHDLFVHAHTPSAGSLVLPADRIRPLLEGGPLLRSSTMPRSTGILVSQAGDPIDLVVATPPTAQFLRMTPDAKYLFRVYEKFVVRIKDLDQMDRSQSLYTFSM